MGGTRLNLSHCFCPFCQPQKHGSENRAGSSRDAMAGNDPFYHASAPKITSEGWTWKPHRLFPGLEDG